MTFRQMEEKIVLHVDAKEPLDAKNVAEHFFALV